MIKKKTITDKLEPPTSAALNTALGDAAKVWNAIVSVIGERFSPLDQEWKPSKARFGQICLLQHKRRTLLYMTPDGGEILIAIVLGERAAATIAKSRLPARTKKLVAEARPYAEGRGIRFPVRSSKDVSMIRDLVAIKTNQRTQP